MLCYFIVVCYLLHFCYRLLRTRRRFWLSIGSCNR